MAALRKAKKADVLYSARMGAGDYRVHLLTKPRVKAHSRLRSAGALPLTLSVGFCFACVVFLLFARPAFSAAPKRPTRIIISAIQPNPSVVGEPVTLSFAVAPLTPSVPPTGKVFINAGAANCQAAAQSGACTVVSPLAGRWSVMATYYGDNNFNSSSSMTVVFQTVTDFALSVPASLTGSLKPSQEKSFSLKVSSLEGFTGVVSLSCPDLPAGARCNFSPSSLMLSGQDTASSTVTLQTSPNTPNGEYTVTIRGISGSGDPATGGLTRREQTFIFVDSAPSDVSPGSRTRSRGTGSGGFMQAVRENLLLAIIDLTAIVVFGGLILFFAGRALHRKWVNRNRISKPKITMALWFFGTVLIGIIIGISLGGGDNFSENQIGCVLTTWLLFALGISLIFYGLSTYRQYRFLSDTAGSSIRGLAMGFVETSGFATPAGQPPAPSPIFAKACLSYQLGVEIGPPFFGNQVESVDWQKIQWSEVFTDRPDGRFYLQDATGKVLVEVRGAHFDFFSDHCEIAISPAGAPRFLGGDRPNADALAAYLSGEGISESAEKKPFKPGHLFRLSERCIRPGHRYSVAGTCAENPNPKDERDRNMIVKGETQRTFEISWLPEKEVESQLLRRAKLAVYGGAALAVVSIAFILIVVYL